MIYRRVNGQAFNRNGMIMYIKTRSEIGPHQLCIDPRCLSSAHFGSLWLRRSLALTGSRRLFSALVGSAKPASVRNSVQHIRQVRWFTTYTLYVYTRTTRACVCACACACTCVNACFCTFACARIIMCVHVRVCLYLVHVCVRTCASSCVYCVCVIARAVVHECVCECVRVCACTFYLFIFAFVINYYLKINVARNNVACETTCRWAIICAAL